MSLTLCSCQCDDKRTRTERCQSRHFQQFSFLARETFFLPFYFVVFFVCLMSIPVYFFLPFYFIVVFFCVSNVHSGALVWNSQCLCYALLFSLCASLGACTRGVTLGGGNTGWIACLEVPHTSRLPGHVELLLDAVQGPKNAALWNAYVGRQSGSSSSAPFDFISTKHWALFYC